MTSVRLSLSRQEVASPTLLPWKNFWAEEWPVVLKTGAVNVEVSAGCAPTGTRVFSRNSVLRTATWA
jgi:hypothetical protein